MDMIFFYMECFFFYVDIDIVSINNYELFYSDFNKWFLYDLFVYLFICVYVYRVNCLLLFNRWIVGLVDR